MSTSPHNLDRVHASFEQTVEEIKGLARQIGSPAGTPRYADRDGRVHGWNFRAVERSSGYLDWDSAGSEEASKLEHFKEEMEPFPGGTRCVFPPLASGPVERDAAQSFSCRSSSQEPVSLSSMLPQQEVGSSTERSGRSPKLPASRARGSPLPFAKPPPLCGRMQPLSVDRQYWSGTAPPGPESTFSRLSRPPRQR